MPTPQKNENKSDYISRCVKQIMSEGKDQEAALGQCYGMYDEYKKKSKATISFDKDEIIIE